MGILQKESINRDRDGENISDNDDDDAVSAHAQLDRINQSMEVNAGQITLLTHGILIQFYVYLKYKLIKSVVPTLRSSE